VCLSLSDLLDYFQCTPVKRRRYPVVIRHVEDDGDQKEALFQFLQCLPDHIIFIDEIDKYCGPNRWVDSCLELLNSSRHCKVDIISAARRPAKVHRDVTGLAQKIIIFHTHEVRDVKYIQDECGKDVADMCPHLKPRQFVEWSPFSTKSV